MINEQQIGQIQGELRILKDNYDMTHNQMVELNQQANNKWNELRKESEDKWNELRKEQIQTQRWSWMIMVAGFAAIGALGFFN